MKDEITLIMLGIMFVTLIIQSIFRMKYKKDMYTKYLSYYEMGTSYLADEIIKKLFQIDFNGKKK